MVAAFSVDQGKFTSLLIYAAVGIVFAIVGLLLYRKRNLECAGDAIAFPILQPLFQLVCAVGVGTLVVMGVEAFLAYRIGAGMSMLYLLLFCGAPPVGSAQNASEAHHTGVPAAQLGRPGDSDRHGRREPGRYPL